jgi:superfamily II DNA or RNA helicase
MSPHPDTAIARPTRLRMRPWQSEALGKLAASGSVDFLAVATPGAGKTTFALAAAVQHLAEHPRAPVVVVAPTQHLKHQWAAAAQRVGLHLDPGWSSRLEGLPADMHGIVTTYQQVATSASALAPHCRGAFVVLDEIHHAGDERTWGGAVLEAFGGAGRRLALSGTPFRSDTSAIPFVDYHLDEARADFEYGYGDALADGGVVRPVYFPRVGGFMEWVAPDGEVLAATFDDEVARDHANQRLRTALSVEGEWLPTVLAEADAQLRKLRAAAPEAGGLVIASDQEHARAIASLLARRGGEVVVATSDDPDASEKIAAFARGSSPWIVAVRMVSEGVDIPRLRVAVYATTTTTELFFRQAVGRVVRWTPGRGRQKAWVFLPDDPRLRLHAARVAESRRHSLRRRAEAREVDALSDPLGALAEGGDAEQLSMFAVIGSVALDRGVFGDDPDDPDASDATEPPGVELVLLPPPPPAGAVRGGGAGGVPDAATDGAAGDGSLTLRQRKDLLRGANADVAMELVRATGWGHAQVNRELNRLSGIDSVPRATLAQLERRLEEGRRWLRRC